VAVTLSGRLASAEEMVSLAARASSPEAGAASTPKRAKRVARKEGGGDRGRDDATAVVSVSHGEAWKSDSSSSAFMEAAWTTRRRASRRRETTRQGCCAARALLAERLLSPWETSVFRKGTDGQGGKRRDSGDAARSFTKRCKKTQTPKPLCQD